MAHITLSQLTTVLQRIVSWATGKFAAKNTYSGKLEYADMPVVVLASMGSELDGTSTQRPMSAGDTYYLPSGQGAGARIMFVDSIGTAVKISDPVSNVIYCNAYTGLLYRWDASDSDMVSVGGDGDGLRKVYVGTNDFSSLDALNSAEASGVYQVIGQSSQKIIGILVVSSDNTPFIVTQWLFSALVLSDEFSGSLTGVQYANGMAHIIHRFYNVSNTSYSDVPLNTWGEWKVYGLTLDEMSEFLNAKQDTLTFDNTPTANSNNPVKSGGVYTALATKANSADLASVATSGSYNDLSNKPTILSQSDVQDMIDDAVDDISDGVSKVKIGSTEYSPNINGVVDISSGVSAAQPTIDPNTGNWIVNGQVTQYPSQGAQGNSGYTGAANELEVVNNLTDGGATKALSAEMGKVLGARHLYVTEDATHININIASSLQVLNVSPLTLAFNAQVGGNQSKTISISGESVSGNVTLEVDGSTMFTLSQNSISPVGGGVDSTVTVTYFPVGETTQNATLNVKVGNNIVGVVRLQGVAAIPSLSLSASSLGIYGSSASSTVYVIGSLLSGNVVGVSSSADFSINPSTIAAADINAAGAQGVPVVISRVSGASANDATVTFTDSADGLSASLDVTYEGTPAVDDIITKGGIRYKVLANNKLEVEHSTGTTTDPSTYSGDVFTIPSTVTWAGTDYTVSSIGNSAFYKSQIRQVIIPNTIESVEYRAFANMSALQYLDLPDSVTSVGNYVQNDPLLIRLTVPKNATHSAQWVYTSCTIQTMIVPAGTTNPFSQGYSLSGTTIGTMRIETTSGTASGENGVLSLNANFSYQKSQASKLQVPTGMKQYYSDSSKTHAGRWLKLLGWNGSDNGTSADTLTAAIAKIEEITIS